MDILFCSFPVLTNSLALRPKLRICNFNRNVFRSKASKPHIPRHILQMSTTKIDQGSPQHGPAVIQIGTGCDLHGQNATLAAVRACKDAIQFNSLPGLQRLLPDGNFSNMQVKVLLGVPSDFVESVDTSTVENVFPYGKVSVDVVVGGLLCHSGIVIAEHKDGPEDDRAIVVVASVEVYC